MAAGEIVGGGEQVEQGPYWRLLPQRHLVTTLLDRDAVAGQRSADAGEVGGRDLGVDGRRAVTMIAITVASAAARVLRQSERDAAQAAAVLALATLAAPPLFLVGRWWLRWSSGRHRFDRRADPDPVG